MQFNNIIETIGNTPTVKLPKYSSDKIQLFAKLEGTNPGGSVKDRIAYFMIKDAEKRGILDKNKTIIEATSGNTGIGLAMISAVKGYEFTAVMPESVSEERKKLLKAYGAKVILTDGKKGTNYAIEVARNIVDENKDKYVMLDQFNNSMNVQAHYETTGQEIIAQVPKVTHFVAGVGTGGTIMGVGKRLKEFNPKIQIIGIEPRPKSKIQGLRNMSAYTPSIYDESKLDDKLMIEDGVVFKLAQQLFRKEGISVGISSGAALWGAIEIGKKIEKGVIVTVFPDRGDKYISTDLFEF